MLCSDLAEKRADAPPLRRLLHKAHAASPRGVAHGRGPRLAPELFSPGTKQGCGSHQHSHSHILDLQARIPNVGWAIAKRREAMVPGRPPNDLT